MPDEAAAQPMLQTILERINVLEVGITDRLDRIEIQVDRTASVAHETRAELRELKNSLRDILHTAK